MALKSIIYLIFFSIISYYSRDFILTESYAASIIPPTKTKPANKLTKSSNKEVLLPDQVTEIDKIYYPVNFIQISDFTNPPYISKNKQKSAIGQVQTNNRNPVLYTNLYEQGKEFFIANKNNEVLQDSLIIFSQTKQFLIETDLMLYNLTQDLFLSLNLADPNKNALLLLQQRNKATTSAKNIYRQQIEITRLQGLNKSNAEEKYISDNSLFTLIFNRKNLYYLIAIIFLFYIVKQIIKLMFMKGLHNKQNGR